MVKNNKKQFYTALAIVLGLFILSFIIIFFTRDKNDLKVNNNSLVVSFKKDNRIILKNILPVSDKLGKKFDGKGTDAGIQGFIEFSIKNVSDKTTFFEIYLTKNNNDSKEIAGDYVKVYLTDKTDKAVKEFDSNKIPSYSSLLILESIPGAKLLMQDKIEAGKEKSYKLRAWLSDLYAVSTDEEIFDFTIRVKEV